MNDFFSSLMHIVTVLVLLWVSGCSRDTSGGASEGITDFSWDETVHVSGSGKTLEFTFTALADWAVSSSADWCSVLTPSSGSGGHVILALGVEANAGEAERASEIRIVVSGYETAVFTVQQSAGVILNEWMFNYMESHYLWNQAIARIKPDYSLDNDEFLQKVLSDVAVQNDVNHDDGYWVDGERQYFYSNLQRFSVAESASTRGIRPQDEGFGFGQIAYDYVWDGDEPTDRYCCSPLVVAPGSPADLAGFKRGDTIYRIDGKEITSVEESWNVLMFSEAGTTVTLTVENTNTSHEKQVTITATRFDDHPVLRTEVLDAANGDKVGYLAYGAFNANYDDELVDAVGKLKAAGAKHLIVDLRYNGGGYAVSSVVLATLVAGEAQKGRVFLKCSFNESRTASGEKNQVYRIGDAHIEGFDPDILDSEWAPIADAVNSALDLTTVYILCTERTASASECLINGLRGLGLDVRLIGGITNGKNVGMEPKCVVVGKYEYQFSPITFYVENGNGDRDYGAGFVPDVVVDEFAYPTYEFGDARDPLTATALLWIETGTRPDAPARHAALRSRPEFRLHLVRRNPLDGIISVNGERLRRMRP